MHLAFAQEDFLVILEFREEVGIGVVERGELMVLSKDDSNLCYFGIEVFVPS